MVERRFYPLVSFLHPNDLRYPVLLSCLLPSCRIKGRSRCPFPVYVNNGLNTGFLPLIRPKEVRKWKVERQSQRVNGFYWINLQLTVSSDLKRQTSPVVKKLYLISSLCDFLLSPSFTWFLTIPFLISVSPNVLHCYRLYDLTGCLLFLFPLHHLRYELHYSCLFIVLGLCSVVRCLSCLV